MIVDCETHPPLMSIGPLRPYLDAYWSEMVALRGNDALVLADYPVAAGGNRAPPPADLRIELPLWGGPVAASPWFAAALAAAGNDWMADRMRADPSLRGSLSVALNNPRAAVAEIERHAATPGFVQLAVFAGSELPLGRMEYRPILAAAAAAGLALAIHPGGAARHAPTPSGWPSFLAEHHAAIPAAFEAQVLSLIFEGTFAEIPDLTVVLCESGAAWLPQFMWRATKLWRGTRAETPWVDRPPDEVLRDRFRLTLAPFDVADPAEGFERLCDEAGSDAMWLYASDHPHGGGAELAGRLPPAAFRRIASENPRATYRKLQEN